jgi:hypothetical protein
LAWPHCNGEKDADVMPEWHPGCLGHRVFREDATLALDRSGENFTKNLVTMRLEGRFGFAVKRPNAFVEVALAG